MPQTHLHTIRPVLLSQLQQASQTIEAAVAWFTDDLIFDILLQRLRQGVTVKLVLHDDAINLNKSFDWPEFTRLGGRAYYFSDSRGGTMHHKFCLIDRQTLLIGSYNWTYNAANRNRENLIVLSPSDGIDTTPFLEELTELIRLSRPVIEPVFSKSNSVYQEIIPHPTIDLLRIHIRTLEIEIAVLEEETRNVESLISQYDHLIRVYLGDLIMAIAELKAQRAERLAAQSGRRSDTEQAKNFRAAYEKTSQSVYEARTHPQTTLPENEQTELRRLFRKAAAQTHPDRFANDLVRYAQANAFMARLNEAYARKNLHQLRQLVAHLDDGLAFDTATERIDDLTLLEKRLSRLMARKAELEAQLEAIRQQEGYQWMTAEGDKEERLQQMRKELVEIQKELLTIVP